MIPIKILLMAPKKIKIKLKMKKKKKKTIKTFKAYPP